MIDAAMRHSIRKFFCLSETATVPADDWSVHSVGRRYLAAGPDLPLRKVRYDGEEGLLLGWPIHHQDHETLDQASLDKLAGRWVLITESSVIPDPLATYSVVYSADNRVVAASPAVIPDGWLVPDTSLNECLDLPNSDLWYPFGLTPWKNLSRLLPDHVLDLSNFRVKRIRRTPIAVNDSAAIQRISRRLQEILSILSETAPVTILMTAGNDSRILLSASRGITGILLLTLTGRRTSIDQRVAEQVSKLAGAEHQTREISSDDKQSRIWFEVVGRCVAGAAMRSAGTKNALDANRQYLKGVGGEVGRITNYNRPGDPDKQTIEASELVDRLHLPQHPSLLSAANTWMSGLPTYTNVVELIELTYRENRIGAWASPQLHADSVYTKWIFPFNDREILDNLRFLSNDMKYSRQSPRLIIDTLWPTLNSIPVNPLAPHAKIRKYAKRFISGIKR